MSRAWMSLHAGIGLLALTWAAGLDSWFVGTSTAEEAKSSPPIWTVPEIGALPNNAYGRLVRRGRDLITATYAYIGPEVADRARGLPAIISPAAIATFRPERRSSASRCSGYWESIRAIAPAPVRRSPSRTDSMPA